MSTVFKFSKELIAHTGDVRSLCIPKPGQLISGSRDFSVRLWNIDGVSEGKLFSNHTNYVTAITNLLPSELYPQGLILTASNDKLIRAFSEDQGELLFVLKGHTDAVCALSTDDKELILSGSWDCTTKLWKKNVCLATLNHRGATVWSVLFIPTSEDNYTLTIATGSSDSIISIWLIPRSKINEGGCVYECDTPTRTLIGHTGCIRSIQLLNACYLVSASNDSSLRCWDLKKNTCIAEFYGHTNFVYSIAIAPNKDFIVSAGEDRSVRIWPIPKMTDDLQQLESIQTLSLPCQTAWCVVVTFDGDIIVGCCDKKIRIFSKNFEHQASTDALKAYETELATFKVAAESLQVNLNKEVVQSSEAILIPGKTDGQVIVVREESDLICYQWSSIDNQWMKVGNVVGSSADSATGMNRTLFEGKEYDFVFSVDFDESKPPVRLPFNKCDDPWVAAQQFLQRHTLPQDYLETVANYIIKNAGLSVNQSKTSFNSSMSDPFTGLGRYVPDGSTGENIPHSRLIGTETYFPSTNFVSLENMNINLLLGKLSTFNDESNHPLSFRDLNLIRNLSPTNNKTDVWELTEHIIEALPYWSTENAYPLFDLLRSLVCWPGVSDLIFASASWTNILKISDLQRLLDSSDIDVNPPSPSASNCILFVIRLMVNSIAVDGQLDKCASPATSISIIVRLAARIAGLLQSRKFDLTEKKHHRIAIATLIMNLAVLSNLHSDDRGFMKVLPALRGLPGLCIRMSIDLLLLDEITPGTVARVPPEATIRLLIALGTAIHQALPDPTEEAKTSKVIEAVRAQRIRLIGSAASPGKTEDEILGWKNVRAVLVFWAEAETAQVKIRQCAASLLSMLQ